jgi:hypothetical protein
MGSENTGSSSGGGAQEKNEKQDETQITTTKIARKISFSFSYYIVL